jgi:hypothetical protein
MGPKNLLLNCFLLLSVVALIQCSDTDDEDSFACFVFNKKPDPRSVLPKKTGTIPGKPKPADLARHHVIPFDFLRTFFNYAATVKVDTQLRTAIDQQIRHLLDSYVDMPNLITTELRSKIRGATEQETVVKAIKFMYAWLPGNIFYGPTSNLRSDDPHGEFEVNCHDIVGDKNYRTLGNLHNKMVKFINNASQRNADNFRDIVTDLLGLFTHRTPFEYNQNQWEIDPKQRSKVRIRIPTGTITPTILKVPTVHADVADVLRAGAAAGDCFSQKMLQLATEPFKKLMH